MKKFVLILLCLATILGLGGFAPAVPCGETPEQRPSEPLVTLWDTEDGQGKLRITFPPEEEGSKRDDQMTAFIAGYLAEAYGTKLTSDQYTIVN